MNATTETSSKPKPNSTATPVATPRRPFYKRRLLWQVISVVAIVAVAAIAGYVYGAITHPVRGPTGPEGQQGPQGVPGYACGVSNCSDASYASFNPTFRVVPLTTTINASNVHFTMGGCTTGTVSFSAGTYACSFSALVSNQSQVALVGVEMPATLTTAYFVSSSPSIGVLVFSPGVPTQFTLFFQVEAGTSGSVAVQIGLAVAVPHF
jgi:hypothetical protein